MVAMVNNGVLRKFILIGDGKMKIALKFEVPDKGCDGCRFHRHLSNEVSYHQYNECEWCELFDCRINKSKKCISCESCEVTTNNVEVNNG